MRALLDRVMHSFWLIPTTLIVVAMGLAEAAVWASQAVDLSPAPGSTGPERLGVSGARALLAAIAGSTLGAATMAFSITISVVVTAATAYGPRLVRNFMDDRSNQAVLGCLVATFVYSLLVLRTIRAAQEQQGDAFVPYLAVYLGIAWAVLDAFLVVWFIHHIAMSVQLESITERVKDDFVSVLERTLPEEQADSAPLGPVPSLARTRHAGRDGYVTAVDVSNLSALAARHNTTLRVLPRVGDHVLGSDPLVAADDVSVLDEAAGLVTLSASRSTTHDLRFSEQQVVELAVRALSPGTNDPYTAVNAVEALGVGITRALRRPAPTGYRTEGGGHLWYSPPSLTELVDKPFDHIRPYALEHPPVIEALLTLAARVERDGQQPAPVLRAQAQASLLLDQVEDSQLTARDKERVRDHHASLQHELASAESLGTRHNPTR